MYVYKCVFSMFEGEMSHRHGRGTKDSLGWTGKDGSPSPTLGTIIKILW